MLDKAPRSGISAPRPSKCHRGDDSACQESQFRCFLYSSIQPFSRGVHEILLSLAWIKYTFCETVVLHKPQALQHCKAHKDNRSAITPGWNRFVLTSVSSLMYLELPS